MFLGPAPMTWRRSCAAVAIATAFLIPIAQHLDVRAQRAPAPPVAVAAPRLVVLIVVDQLRADYLKWYGAQSSRVCIA